MAINIQEIILKSRVEKAERETKQLRNELEAARIQLTLQEPAIQVLRELNAEYEDGTIINNAVRLFGKVNYTLEKLENYI